MNVLRLKSLSELFKKAPRGINGVGLGFKQKNGVFENIGIPCITYFVDKKISKDCLDELQVIPEKIIIDGVEYITDIVESKNSRPAACFEQSSPDVQILRSYHEKIKGGLAITTTANCALPPESDDGNLLIAKKTGTIAGIFLDNITNSIVGLTAGHILSKNIVNVGNRDQTKQKNIYNIYDAMKIPVLDLITESNTFSYYKDSENLSEDLFPQEVFQFDTKSFVDRVYNRIGIPKRYWPLRTSEQGFNTIDAALIALDKYRIGFPESLYQYGTTDTMGMKFATELEISQMFLNQTPIFSIGQGSGPKKQFCSLVISSPVLYKDIRGYEAENIKASITFENIISIKNKFSQSNPFSDGDSGSLVYGFINGANKILGMLFAIDDNHGYVCRMSEIANKLNISPIEKFSERDVFIDNIFERKAILKDFSQVGFDNCIVENGQVYCQAGVSAQYAVEELRKATSPPTTLYPSADPDTDGDYDFPLEDSLKQMFISSFIVHRNDWKGNQLSIDYSAFIRDSSGKSIPGAEISFVLYDCDNNTYSSCGSRKTIIYSDSGTTGTNGGIFISAKENIGAKKYFCYRLEIISIVKQGYYFNINSGQNYAVFCGSVEGEEPSDDGDGDFGDPDFDDPDFPDPDQPVTPPPDDGGDSGGDGGDGGDSGDSGGGGEDEGESETPEGGSSDKPASPGGSPGQDKGGGSNQSSAPAKPHRCEPWDQAARGDGYLDCGLDPNDVSFECSATNNWQSKVVILGKYYFRKGNIFNSPCTSASLYMTISVNGKKFHGEYIESNLKGDSLPVEKMFYYEIKPINLYYFTNSNTIHVSLKGSAGVNSSVSRPISAPDSYVINGCKRGNQVGKFLRWSDNNKVNCKDWAFKDPVQFEISRCCDCCTKRAWAMGHVDTTLLNCSDPNSTKDFPKYVTQKADCAKEGAVADEEGGSPKFEVISGCEGYKSVNCYKCKKKDCSSSSSSSSSDVVGQSFILSEKEIDDLVNLLTAEDIENIKSEESLGKYLQPTIQEQGDFLNNFLDSEISAFNDSEFINQFIESKYE